MVDWLTKHRRALLYVLTCLAFAVLLSYTSHPRAQQVVRRPITSAIAGPDSIADLELWLPISALSGADEDEITTWPDQSGNGRDGTGVADAITKPLYRTAGGPSGGPSVELGLAGIRRGHFTLPNFATGFTSGEIFLVPQVLPDDPPTDSGVNMGPPAGDWGTGTQSLYPFTDGVIYENWGSTVRKTTNNPTTNLTNWVVYNIRTASGDWSWSINGATSGNDFFSTASNTVAFGTAPRIGTNGRNLNGRIVEVIFYSRVLNSTERFTIHAYLNSTYGFSLPIAKLLPFRRPFERPNYIDLEQIAA